MAKFEWNPIEFDCKQCHIHVRTKGYMNGKPDKRSVFCSRKCEVKYWKHAYRNKLRKVATA